MFIFILFLFSCFLFVSTFISSFFSFFFQISTGSVPCAIKGKKSKKKIFYLIVLNCSFDILCFIILDGADTSNLEATKIITKKIIIGIDSLPRNPKIPKEGLRLVFNLNCI